MNLDNLNIQVVPKSFHVMSKPTGAVCNLDCTYCFFLSKEALYPGSPFRMTDEQLETYIEQLLAGHQSSEVNIAWQGGEPTMMGIDFYRKSVELAEKHKRPDQNVLHSMQTNGVLIDDEWAVFFKENNYLIGLSMDGPKDIHDVYRVNKGGSGTFDQVMKGFEALKRHDVDVNILCTIHDANADRPLDVYKFFRDDLGVEHLQFIPIIERATKKTLSAANEGWHKEEGKERILYTQHGALVTERSVTAKQYGSFLNTIFDEWVANDVGKVFIQMFDAALGAHLDFYTLCIHAPTCGLALAMEHNGDLYSCDHFVEPKYKLGNINDKRMLDLVVSPKQNKFGQDKQTTLPKYCQECPVLFACNGGCPKDRFIRTPDGKKGLNYLCEGYKDFFGHTNEAFSKMADLLRQGRYAEEIMNNEEID